MSTARHHLQVFRSVVPLVVVNVMHYLVAAQFPPNFFLCHDLMLKPPTIAYADNDSA